MVINKIRELEATKAKLAHLEKSVAAQLRKELAGLPAAYGFDSIADFFKSVKAAAFGGGKSRRRSAKAKKSPAKKSKRRRRAVITDSTRAEVKKLSEAGKTGNEIAKSLRISLPSVQNIKKALGLVKARK